MRRPVPEVPEQAFLPFALGTQFENLLFPKQVEGKGRGDGIREFADRGFAEVARQIVEKQRVARFVDFDQLAAERRIDGQVAVLEIIDAAFEQRVFGEEIDDSEGMAANGDDVHAAVGIAPDDLENFSGATDAGEAVVDGQEHAEGRARVEAFADHAAIARLKNVQGKLFAGEENDVQRK